MKNLGQPWVLFVGPLVTLTLGFGWTFDNVNPVKLLALGIVSGIAAAEIIQVLRKSWKMLLCPPFIVSILFLIALLIPLTLANSPFAQQIYGTSGRNLGLLHYFFLIIIFLGFSFLNAKVIWPKIMKTLVLVGALEAFYSFCQLIGFDVLAWENPNRWTFGTFGNPNYLSSFLALSVISTSYLGITEKRSILKISWFAVALFQITMIFFSDSSQGLILVTFGLLSILIILFFKRSKILGWLVLLFGSQTALFAFLGIFQHGPLAKYLYQESISYRGDYWRAGVRMFSDNWFYGVGLDSYGDYYYMYRDGSAAYRRAIETFSNSAHNLFIDLAATGGIILLVAYLLIIGFVSFSIYRTIKGKDGFTFEYKILIILWMLFNLQTLISINVPSLAVWGSIFSGLIIAFSNENSFRENLGLRNRGEWKSQLTIRLSCIAVGLIIVSPLIIRDVKINNAIAKNDIYEMRQAVLTFPRDANQIAQMAKVFDKVGLAKISLGLAKEAIGENSNSSIAWEFILNHPDANPEDIQRARENLRRLDPLNRIE